MVFGWACAIDFISHYNYIICCGKSWFLQNQIKSMEMYLYCFLLFGRIILYLSSIQCLQISISIYALVEALHLYVFYGLFSTKWQILKCYKQVELKYLEISFLK